MHILIGCRCFVHAYPIPMRRIIRADAPSCWEPKDRPTFSFLMNLVAQGAVGSLRLGECKSMVVGSTARITISSLLFFSVVLYAAMWLPVSLPPRWPALLRFEHPFSPVCLSWLDPSHCSHSFSLPAFVYFSIVYCSMVLEAWHTEHLNHLLVWFIERIDLSPSEICMLDVRGFWMKCNFAHWFHEVTNA